MATIIIGRVLSSTTDSVRADQGNAGASPWLTRQMNALVSEPYDYIALTYNAQNKIQTATYKLGGAGGTLVATLTLTYTTGLLATVTRS